MVNSGDAVCGATPCVASCRYLSRRWERAQPLPCETAMCRLITQRSQGHGAALLGSIRKAEGEDRTAGLVSDELSDNHRIRGRTVPDSRGRVSRSTSQQSAGHRSAWVVSHRRASRRQR